MKSKKNKRLINKVKNVGIILSSLTIGLMIYLHFENALLTRIEVKRQTFAFGRKYERLAYTPSTNIVMGASSQQSDAKSVPIVVYHGITRETKEQEDVDFKTFQEQMYWLKDNGYKTITTKDLEDFIYNGKNLPGRSFLLTFDDGRKDSYYPVDGILEKLNFNAVMFVISSEALKPKNNFHLTSKELKYALESGRWEIQSHSHNTHNIIPTGPEGQRGHALANKLWLSNENRLETDNEYRDRIANDLRLSKQILEKEFNITVNGFAVPYGDYGQHDSNYPKSKDVLLEVEKSIFKYIYYTPWDEIGDRNYPNTNTFTIRRIDVDKDVSTEDFIEIMENGEDKEIGYSDNFSKDNGWVTDWGASKFENNTMILFSDPGAGGATTYLTGTQTWQNFEAATRVTLSNTTSSFSLLFGADSFGNYSFCNFSRNSVNYGTKKAEKTINIKSVSRIVFFSEKNELGIRVKDNLTECLINKMTVLSYRTVAKEDNKGMIGFSIWSPTTNAQAKILSLTSEIIK